MKQRASRPSGIAPSQVPAGLVSTVLLNLQGKCSLPNGGVSRRQYDGGREEGEAKTEPTFLLVNRFPFPSFPHKYTFRGRAQPGKMQKIELTALGLTCSTSISTNASNDRWPSPLVSFPPEEHTWPVRELGPGESLGGSVQAMPGRMLSSLQLQCQPFKFLENCMVCLSAQTS